MITVLSLVAIIVYLVFNEVDLKSNLSYILIIIYIASTIDFIRETFKTAKVIQTKVYFKNEKGEYSQVGICNILHYEELRNKYMIEVIDRFYNDNYYIKDYHSFIPLNSLKIKKEYKMGEYNIKKLSLPNRLHEDILKHNKTILNQEDILLDDNGNLFLEKSQRENFVNFDGLVIYETSKDSCREKRRVSPLNQYKDIVYVYQSLIHKDDGYTPTFKKTRITK